MKKLLIATITLLLLTGPALAEQVDVGGGLVLDITFGEGWSLSAEPSESLLAETAEHLAHEAQAKGAAPTEAQLLEIARKRLAANEAFLHHVSGNAHLDIDFSPLEPGEKPPSSRTVRDSAHYAAQSLEGEEEVSDVVWDVSSMKVKGARNAYLLTADYRQHEEPVRFLGVIGFAGEQWFFLYYTDRSKQPELSRDMRKILDSIDIRPAGN